MLKTISAILKQAGVYQEFDFLVVDLKTATIYAIEVKRTLTLAIPKGADKSVADKVLLQLQTAFHYFNEWFGADVCQEWSFKPVIFCLVILDDIKPLCMDCDIIVCCGKQDFIDKVGLYVKNNQVEVTPRLVEDFKVMARYLIFGLTAKNLPTTSRFPQEVTKYMEEAGSWESIMLWCFLTPGQMELLSKPKVVLFSGWGGGKTTTATEVCKMWAKHDPVLILVNGCKTYDQTMLLVHNLRLKLKNVKNITIHQIDFLNDTLESLLKIVKGHKYAIFDEMAGDPYTLISPKFRNKFNALTEFMTNVWIALSNFEIYQRNATKEEDLEETFPGYVIVTSLNKNMRNPVHIKDQVKKTDYKKE